MTSDAPVRPVFGTRSLYEALADGLAADPAWATKGKALTMTMTHVYTEPINRAFFMEFEEGAITTVEELASPDDRPAEYVLSASPEIWERVLVTQTLAANLALVSRRIAVKGKMGWILKNIGAFNHLLSVLTTLDPVVEAR
jgi:hypothetical protein